MLDKETLGEKLAEIRDAIKNADRETVQDDDWYYGLYECDEDDEDMDDAIDEADAYTIEDFYAVEAVKYPEFLPIVREIVEGITDINIKLLNEPLDVYSEWSAGSFMAARLALATKDEKDLALFATHLGERDLDHEADPYNGFGINEIFEEIGFTDATLPVVLGTLFANSQHRYAYLEDDDLTAYLNEGDNVNKFLASLAEWAGGYSDISSVSDAFRLVLSDIFEVEPREAAKKFHEIRKERTPVKEDFMA